MADNGGNGDGTTTAERIPTHCENKEVGDSSEDLDSITCMPDVILQQILSSIETKEAIRTSVLSKRWRYVWSDTPSLSFCWPMERSLDAGSIEKTLTRYTARKMMSFHIETDIMSNLTHFDKLIELIELAMSRNAENMALKLCFHFQTHEYRIPDFFYTNSSVKQIRLDLYSNYLIPRCSVSWTSLKKLSLRACTLSDESFAKILSGCPILESLTLGDCVEHLMVLDLSKSPRLRVLVINCYWWTWLTHSPQIVAPHIHYLRLENSQFVGCTLVDVSSLTECSLDIPFDLHNEVLFKVDSLQAVLLKQLEKLQNVDKLTIGENFLKILSLAHCRLGNLARLPMFKAKFLTLETTISPYVINGILMVLENSPELKKLTLIHKRLDRFIPEKVLDKFLSSRGLMNPFQSMIVGTYSKNRELKSKEVASFIELMLNKTQTLEKMVLRLEGCLKGSGFEELLQIVPTLSRTNNVSIVIS